MNQYVYMLWNLPQSHLLLLIINHIQSKNNKQIRLLQMRDILQYSQCYNQFECFIQIFYCYIILIQKHYLFMTQDINPHQTLIKKTLRLQNDFSPQHDIIKVYFQYIPRTRQINLSKTLRELASANYPIENSQFFYWNYDQKMFVYIGIFPFKQQFYVKYELFQYNIIHLRYKRIKLLQRPQQKLQKFSQKFNGYSSQRMEGFNEPIKNSKRIKQRSIQEVIELVSKWRFIYEKLDCNGKKLYTLQTAARDVGISKKTLDNYYLQLKYGQLYNFDFQYHKHAKIGILRSYVKQNHKIKKKVSCCITNPINSNHEIQKSNLQCQLIEQQYFYPDDQQYSSPFLFHRDDSFEFTD